MANAHDANTYAQGRLRDLAQRYEAIGDVCGSGLFFGVKLVKDRRSLTPDAELANQVVNAMHREGILLNKASIHGNTLKIRPPMPFGRSEANLLVDTMDKVMGDLVG